MRTVCLSAPALAGLVLCALTVQGQSTFQEDFATTPEARGWRVFGDTSLFHWSAGNQNIEVTWDSSRTNSYFHRPLGTILTKRDDFSFAFDLQLRDIAIGTNPGKPVTFQFAAGLINLADATGTNYLRGTGTDSPNLVEFDYFPDSGFGATVSPTIISSNMNFATSFTPLEMTTNDWFHITMIYTASNQTLVTMMTTNGFPFGSIQDVKLATTFTDFHVDSFAVSSYSDAGQDPRYDEGSILAHGVIDNLVVTTPEPPVSNVSGIFTNGGWRAEFMGRASWSYTLERTEDFKSWTAASPAAPGNEGKMVLVDTNTVSSKAFYRVHAGRP